MLPDNIIPSRGVGMVSGERGVDIYASAEPARLRDREPPLIRPRQGLQARPESPAESAHGFHVVAKAHGRGNSSCSPALLRATTSFARPLNSSIRPQDDSC